MFEGTVAITSHEPTNSLVITSSLHDYAALKRVIDRLDSERRQVFIEAVVITLDVNNSRDLGLNYFSGVPDACRPRIRPCGAGSAEVTTGC